MPYTFDSRQKNEPAGVSGKGAARPDAFLDPGRETSEQKLIRESMERFLTFDQETMIRRFSLKADENHMYICFIGREFTIDRQNGALTQDGRPANSSEMAAIFELLTKSASAPVPLGKWASIAQLCTNTTSTELTKYAKRLVPFEGHPELLSEACVRLGGKEAKGGDVSYILPVFENIPVWFQYWEKDEEFDTSVQFLWDASVSLHFRWATLWNIMDCLVDRILEMKNI